ncbi:hypothetical protein CEXT_536111 [Caerostris extrusa]|uniref:Uncharacterized protein n=1 Tax=Caerostris extrusa TaxID=172846 RepID=A0AAV4UC58_CAEEX|nr:hypothetical protein CEXT_536111 [Caerostris extrusa]
MHFLGNGNCPDDFWDLRLFCYLSQMICIEYRLRQDDIGNYSVIVCLSVIMRSVICIEYRLRQDDIGNYSVIVCLRNYAIWVPGDLNRISAAARRYWKLFRYRLVLVIMRSGCMMICIEYRLRQDDIEIIPLSSPCVIMRSGCLVRFRHKCRQRLGVVSSFHEALELRGCRMS